MNKFLTASVLFSLSAALATVASAPAHAASLSLSFTKLPGLTGGSPAATTVYYADLMGITFDITSISIKDGGPISGSAGGQVSGFDLNAIKFSRTLATSAADVNALPGLNVFNFVSGTVFAPGSQTAPVAPALFGTSGSAVNNAIATLGSFDGSSTTSSSANGFVSLGVNGSLAFNLTSPVSVGSTPLYLYIGEVVDSGGEFAAGDITVSDSPAVPEPTTLAGLALAAAGLGYARRRRGGTA